MGSQRSQTWLRDSTTVCIDTFTCRAFILSITLYSRFHDPVLQMETPKLKRLCSVSRTDLECKTSPLGLKAFTLFSVDIPLNFPYDLELVAFHCHWGLCPQHSPPHFAFSHLQVVQRHKTSPSCSQRKQSLCCCPEPILPPFPKGTTSFLAIYFASKSLNFNQPHCPATNPSKLKNSYSSYAQNSQDPWDTLLQWGISKSQS